METLNQINFEEQTERKISDFRLVIKRKSDGKNFIEMSQKDLNDNRCKNNYTTIYLPDEILYEIRDLINEVLD